MWGQEGGGGGGAEECDENALNPKPFTPKHNAPAATDQQLCVCFLRPNRRFADIQLLQSLVTEPFARAKTAASAAS